MNKGDIVLASLPVSDGSYKERPSLIVSQFPPYNDYLLCGISSQLKQNINETGYLIGEEADYFLFTGLKKSSIIRLNYLVTLPEYLVAGKIGSLPYELFENVVDKLIFLIKQ